MALTVPTDMSFTNRRVREYLVSWGLMTEGYRGKLSEHQKNAIKLSIEFGVEFIDWDSETEKIIPKTSPRKKTDMIAEEVKPLVERGANQIHIISKDGSKTIIEHHPTCGKSIRFCTCKVVDVPDYYDAEQVILVQA